MKIKKYLKKMGEYLGIKRDDCTNSKACLKKVLKKLKQREKDLRELLKEQDSGKRHDMLKDELAIVHTQRKKGIKALRALKGG